MTTYAVLACIGECGKFDGDDVGKRIVGGHEARSWPWMGAIFRIIPFSDPRKGFPYCGCSLISPKWVMTAAHCVIDKYSDFSIENFNKDCKEVINYIILFESLSPSSS